jgi:hypothetical protein
MKSWNYIVGLMVLLMINMGCAPEKKEAVTELQADDLLGSWRLVKTIAIGHEDSTNRRDGMEKFYIKHILKTSNFTILLEPMNLARRYHSTQN